MAGLLEANGVYNVKLLVNRVRPEMIQKNDMMSVKDVQEMLGIPLLGAIPEDPQVSENRNFLGGGGSARMSKVVDVTQRSQGK